jgi:hypothetical protein
VTQDTPAFFTLDRGTVSTTAALIAPVDGRYRMLASAAAPAAIDPESVLEDLAWRVARTDASLAGSMEGWRGWSRLEVGSLASPNAVLVAASEATGELLERAYVGAGWTIRARLYGSNPDLVALGEACLDPRVHAVIVGGRDGVEDEERDIARSLWARAASLARFRDDLAVIACGPFADRPEGIVEDRLFSLPAPNPVPMTSETALRQAARQVGAHLVSRGQAIPTDARTSLRASIGSLAALLGNRVEGLEVGATATSRTLANADGETRHATIADAALLPPEILDDDEFGEAILYWSTLSGDPASRLDDLRELVLRPWTGIDADGLHLRLAVLRAALQRLGRVWDPAPGTDRAADSADVMVLGGGVFATLPPGAAALAVVDGVRRPGAVAMLHDHAGVLAPLGSLPVEADRQRLLADLMDDCLLPVGSALLTGSLGDRGKGGGTMAVSTSLGEDHLRLEPGQLQLVDLPPGIVGRLDIDPTEGAILGVQNQRLTLEVSGGLGGLLVDTRDIPLELPDNEEARRSQLAAWEAPAWTGTER